jgi:chorismate mutase/prephenate dehydratase
LRTCIRDGRGALWQVLKLFDEDAINITRIHSRPSRQKAWDYVFFVDVEGHAKDDNVQRALAKLEAICPMVKQLGSYARG